MDEHLLQATEMILENIITSPEERWKALTDRDSDGMTPVHLAIVLKATFPWRHDEVSIYMF